MDLILTQCFAPETGGVETLVVGLADALARAGREALVLADGSRDPAAAAAHDRAAPYAVRRFGGLKPVRRRRKAWAAAAASARAQTVFADSWKSIEHLKRSAGGPRTICLAHGMELPERPDAAKAARIRAAFDKADLILANSRYTAERVRPFLAPRARLAVATPPISEQPELRPEAVDAVGRRVAGMRPLLATVARLEPRKGVDHVVSALPGLAAVHPDIGFAIAGDGADRPRLEALAADLGVAGRVAFLGRVSDDDKAALMAAADVFVMPARREGESVEGFGIVYLEAGWRGTPSLAGREGGASDAVRDRETGRLCDGSTAAAVEDALRAMLADPAELQRLGSAAERWARAQTWDLRIGDFLDMDRTGPEGAWDRHADGAPAP